jgi:hypothetical protein
MINGKIAILRSLKKISFIGSAHGMMGSPTIHPARIPRKNPAKIKNVSVYFFRIIRA